MADAVMAPILGTISTKAEPILVRGAVRGCSLQFAVLMVDSKYHLGSYLNVRGSIGIELLEKKGTERLGAVLKVIVDRLSFENLETPDGVPSKPTRAYLIADDFSTSRDAVVNSYGGSQLGSLIVLFQAERVIEMLLEILRNGKIGVAFNQGEGDVDLVADVDFEVTDSDPDGTKIRSNQTLERFMVCWVEFGKLLER